MSKPAATTRAVSVRTPGAPAATTEPTEDDVAQMAAESEALEASLLADADAPAPVADLSPDLQALVAREVAKGIAKHAMTMRAAQSAPGQPAVELPSQDSIDAFAIKKEVLTKEGWVVPHQYPQPHVPQSLR